jgi:hypothetical protein
VLRETIGMPLPAAYRVEHDRHVAAARAVLDEATFAEAWATGRALPLEQAIAEIVEATGPDREARVPLR